MANLKDALKETLRDFLALMKTNGRAELLDILRKRYVDEAHHVSQFELHAQRMRYPQFRDRLLRIATEEREHLRWLAERIAALGGDIPAVTAEAEEANNTWQSLACDLEDERRCAADLMEQMQKTTNLDPETAAILTRIYEQEQKHRREIMDMLMRSDPYADWPG